MFGAMPSLVLTSKLVPKAYTKTSVLSKVERNFQYFFSMHHDSNLD